MAKGQKDNCNCAPLIGDVAPKFTAKTTQGAINFPDDYTKKGKWVVLFSHPADFTPICTTEMVTLASMQEKFRENNAELIALSVDSLLAHNAWLKAIKDSINYEGAGKVEVKIPIIDDADMKISRLYGMVHPNSNDTRAVRAVFFIDPKGIVKASMFYPIENGRDAGEMLRILKALQKTYYQGVGTPVNWQPGEDVVVLSEEATRGASPEKPNKKGVYGIDWFLCFRKDMPVIMGNKNKQ